MFILHVVDVILSLWKTLLALLAPPLHIPALWRAHLLLLLILLLFFILSLFSFLLSLLVFPFLFFLSRPLAQLIWIAFCWFGFRGGVTGRGGDRRRGGGRSLSFDRQAPVSSLMGNIERQRWLKRHWMDSMIICTLRWLLYLVWALASVIHENHFVQAKPRVLLYAFFDTTFFRECEKNG